MLAALLAACAAPAPVGAQPPIQALVVVHVEPLPRTEGECTDPELVACGTPLGPPFRRRTQNLSWLLETWAGNERTVEVLLGPEAALAWSGDAATREALSASLSPALIEEPTEALWSALEGARDAGVLSLGIHLHSVIPDGSEQLGRAAVDTEAVGACDAWAGEPLVEQPPAIVDAVLRYGIEGTVPVAERLGMSIQSFSAHVPRTMAEKVAVLDAAADWGLPAFTPALLSKAYSECFAQAVDHPAFEAYATDGEGALGVGEGPLILPGERSIGSMAEHLDEQSDASLGAARRRLLQLLLNRRHAALAGGAARPWLLTVATHDYQLNPISGADPARDEVLPQEGHAYRGDLLSIAADIDALAAADGWLGDRGPAARWVLPEAVSAEGSQFSYSGDGAPLEGLVPEAYPYLPLVAERLAESHLLCAGTSEDVAVFSLSRCPGGWGWGDGFTCPVAPEPVWVLVPDGTDACVSVPGGALQAGAVDETGLRAARWCAGGGLAVPLEGLIVEPGDARWWADGCRQ